MIYKEWPFRNSCNPWMFIKFLLKLLRKEIGGESNAKKRNYLYSLIVYRKCVLKIYLLLIYCEYNKSFNIFLSTCYFKNNGCFIKVSTHKFLLNFDYKLLRKNERIKWCWKNCITYILSFFLENVWWKSINLFIAIIIKL